MILRHRQDWVLSVSSSHQAPGISSVSAHKPPSGKVEQGDVSSAPHAVRCFGQGFNVRLPAVLVGILLVRLRVVFGVFNDRLLLHLNVLVAVAQSLRPFLALRLCRLGWRDSAGLLGILVRLLVRVPGGNAILVFRRPRLSLRLLAPLGHVRQSSQGVHAALNLSMDPFAPCDCVKVVVQIEKDSCQGTCVVPLLVEGVPLEPFGNLLCTNMGNSVAPMPVEDTKQGNLALKVKSRQHKMGILLGPPPSPH
mmetsp:Transcript_102099/g.233891  ORF Transcript_102099/g.233891 Transcript_102099/m.233891 type:complete len:251 (+) Transcript_102099:793-1545(+)